MDLLRLWTDGLLVIHYGRLFLLASWLARFAWRHPILPRALVVCQVAFA